VAPAGDADHRRRAIAGPGETRILVAVNGHRLAQRTLVRSAAIAAGVALALGTTDQLGQATAFGAGVALVLLIEVVLGWIMPPE